MVYTPNGWSSGIFVVIMKLPLSLVVKELILFAPIYKSRFAVAAKPRPITRTSVPVLGVEGITLKLEPSNTPGDLLGGIFSVVPFGFVGVSGEDVSISPEPNSLLLLFNAFHVMTGFDWSVLTIKFTD